LARRYQVMSKVNLREADKLEVTVLVDNYADGTLENTAIAKRALIRPPGTLLAEHGLSCLLKVYTGNEEHWVLLDTGMSPTCLLHNIGAMEIDIGKIESVVLSHGHGDHFGGLMRFLDKAKRGISLTLHPDAFLESRLNVPGRRPVYPPRLDEGALKQTMVVLHREKQASTLASDLVLVTGDVERVTDFEKGFPWAEAKIGGEWVVDPFHHDQGVAVMVRGKGLVVVGGCSHAGIINTVKHAQKVAGIDKVHAILGGFHLSGKLFEPIIGATIEEMKKISPDFVVPMHCTGWKAINQFAKEMPEQFILNAVGTTYLFQLP
jgi:7,8-dihydropterin-6-yl-methyl-4-(beta-D-ribofuranosyl)aminobenzene 5'-phosphate synthase